MLVLQKLYVYCLRREKTKFNDMKMTLKMWIISMLLSDKKKKIAYTFSIGLYILVLSESLITFRRAFHKTNARLNTFSHVLGHVKFTDNNKFLGLR